MSDQSGAMRRLMANDLERLDRLSRQLRIDQTARAIYVRNQEGWNDYALAAKHSYDMAEILEAERERRKKPTETS